MSSGNDADDATLKSEVALVLNEELKSSVYPLVLTAFTAQERVVLTYCNGIAIHGYRGGDNKVVRLTSISIKL